MVLNLYESLDKNDYIILHDETNFGGVGNTSLLSVPGF